MDNSSITMIISLFILLMGSAYFSATETAFSSLNKIRLKHLANNGDEKAGKTLMLADDYDRVLSTILIGNNILNIAAASLSTVIFSKHFGDAGLTLSTIVMTVLVLIFGEITPKSLAKEAPESFAMAATPILKISIFILTPLNIFFACWKKYLSTIINVKNDRSITEEELITIVEEATHGGGIERQEGELIRSAIEFNDLDVADVLTPRVNMTAVAINEEKAKIRDVFLESGYSRLPVFETSVDNIVGVINQKDFHNYVLHTEVSLDKIIKPAVYAANSLKISKLLKILQQDKAHIAIVPDEYGGTLGIVTLEDILEELVGEIWDEHDEVVRDFEKIADNKYIVSSNASLYKMLQLFKINCDLSINSVSGWITYEMGKIPSEGEFFFFQTLQITILEADLKRVNKILVQVTERKEKE